MGTIMLIVAVSRTLAIPKYLDELGIISLDAGIIGILTKISFLSMTIALTTGAVIILSSMVKGMRRHREAE